MTAFLKIDCCKGCGKDKPWEWVPAVHVGNRVLAGTAVWRSQLVQGCCAACLDRAEAERIEAIRKELIQAKLVECFGGERPAREFTFERFRVDDGNRIAFERTRGFQPGKDNLYLWGPCGVGKTHLAYAAARCAVERGLSVEVLRPPKLVRQLRMKDPEEEQSRITGFVRSPVFVIDDLGMSQETAYFRQVFQEILDGRSEQERNGLIVTSKFSLPDLAAKLGDDTIPSRLAGMCEFLHVNGVDNRLARNCISGT